MQEKMDPSAPSAVAWDWRRTATGDDRDETKQNAAARKRGLIGGAVGLLIAALVYQFWKPGLAYVIAGISLTLALLALAAPPAYRKVAGLLDRFGHLVGMAVTWLLMTLLYYILFLPVGLLLRARGKLADHPAPRPAPAHLLDVHGRKGPDRRVLPQAVLMKLLGISCYYHDSAACLVDEGRIVAAAQEERFTRKKHDAGFPFNAVRYCLAEGGWRRARRRRLLRQAAAQVPPHPGDLPVSRSKGSALGRPGHARSGSRRSSGSRPRSKRPWSAAEFAGAKDIYFTEHHESHAASAFYPSPFDEAAVLTLDGVGEWATTTIGVGEGNRLRLLREIVFPHSLGLLYSAFTYFTGFKVNSGEYKLMGLAPYGDRDLDRTPSSASWSTSGRTAPSASTWTTSATWTAWR